MLIKSNNSCGGNLFQQSNKKMKTLNIRRYIWLLSGFLVCAVLIASCGKPGDLSNNFTNSWVTMTAINEGEPLQSDVLTNGYATDDIISITLNSVFRVPADDPTAPDGPTQLDTIVFHSYLVTHRRSDGGPNPASFTGGMSVSLSPDSEAETRLVVVRAFDKHRSPLVELRDDGEIFTTSIITVYGTDGNGNDVEVSGSFTISYANFGDS